MGLKSKPKVVGPPHDVPATVVPGHLLLLVCLFVVCLRESLTL